MRRFDELTVLARRGRSDLSALFAEPGAAPVSSDRIGASPFASGLSSKGVHLANASAGFYDFPCRGFTLLTRFQIRMVQMLQVVCSRGLEQCSGSQLWRRAGWGRFRHLVVELKVHPSDSGRCVA